MGVSDFKCVHSSVIPQSILKESPFPMSGIINKFKFEEGYYI